MISQNTLPSTVNDQWKLDWIDVSHWFGASRIADTQRLESGD
jgi:hypothetical protein